MVSFGEHKKLGGKLMRSMFVTVEPLVPPLAGDQLVTAQWLARLAELSELCVVTIKGGDWGIAMPKAVETVAMNGSGVGSIDSWLNGFRGLVGGLTMIQARLRRADPQALWNQVDKFKPDIVIFDHLRTGWLLQGRQRLLGSLSVYLAHNAESLSYKSSAGFAINPIVSFALRREARKVKCLEGAVVGAADVSVCLTEEDRSRLTLLSPISKMQVIPPWFPVRSVDGGRSPRKLNVLLVGSFQWHAKKTNALWLARRVWPRVREASEDVVLKIVGKRADLLADALDDDSTVQITANVPDVAPFMRSADVFVNPERQSGGIKLKTIEAATYGLPIVSTDSGIEGTGLRDGESCLVANDAAQFARCIQRLIQDRALAVALGSNAREIVAQQFSHELFNERVSSLLMTVT